MAGIHTEAMKKKHNMLIVFLDGLITEYSFKSIKRMARTYLDPKTVEKAKDMDELLNGLEIKGVISVGQYDKLIEIMKTANVGIGIDEIQKTAKEIQDMQNRIPIQEQSEMSHLDHHTSDQDSIHPIPGQRPMMESALVGAPPLHTDRDQHPTQETNSPMPFEGFMDAPDLTQRPVSVQVENCTPQFYIDHHEEKMTRIPRGKALIINVNGVAGEESRQGTNVDRDNLSKLFKQLGFYPIVYNDSDKLTANEIDTKLREFATLHDHKEADACVICLLSHGKEGCIYGTDGKTINLYAVFSYIYNQNCKYQQGKPKLFIIQACRGGMHIIVVLFSFYSFKKLLEICTLCN